MFATSRARKRPCGRRCADRQTAVDAAASSTSGSASPASSLTRMDGDARGGAALAMRHSPASRSSWSASARSSTSSSPSILTGWPPASSTWATWSRLVEQAAEMVDATKPKSSPEDGPEGQVRPRQRLPLQLIPIRRDGRHARALLFGTLPGACRRSRSSWSGKRRRSVFVRQCRDRSIRMTPQGQVATPTCSTRPASGGSPLAPGTSVQDVNRLLKQHRQMQDMMKQMKKAARTSKPLPAPRQLGDPASCRAERGVATRHDPSPSWQFEFGLARGGAEERPFYRIVAADARS